MDLRKGRDARLAAVLAVGIAAALPAAAEGRTTTVEVGPFGRAAQEAFGAAAGDANAFFRRTVTIRRGDRVSWEMNGFHTVTFNPPGAPPPGLIAPDADNPLTGLNDAAGSPFWFNGQPRLLLNPLVAFPQGPSRFHPDELHNSGLPLDEGPPQPYRLRFDRKGTFRYLCIVHPGMDGKVRVKGRNARVPSNAKHRRAARRERQRLLNRVERRSSGVGTENLVRTIQAGNDDRTGATVFKFFPSNPSFSVGDVVTLRMPPQSVEIHTVTFGPSNGEDLYLDQIANSIITPAPGGGGGPPALIFEPRLGYPSENPASGLPAYTAAMHGNGFFNTGVLDSLPATPAPSSAQVRFSEAGEFTFICLVHPFMRGEVTVTP